MNNAQKILRALNEDKPSFGDKTPIPSFRKSGIDPNLSFEDRIAELDRLIAAFERNSEAAASTSIGKEYRLNDTTILGLKKERAELASSLGKKKIDEMAFPNDRIRSSTHFGAPHSPSACAKQLSFLKAVLKMVQDPECGKDLWGVLSSFTPNTLVDRIQAYQSDHNPHWLFD